ncbi:MAG: hypothetical protein ACRDBI_12525 [Shewanella sp.]
MPVKGVLDIDQRAAFEKEHGTKLVCGCTAMAAELKNQVSRQHIRNLVNAGYIGYYTDPFRNPTRRHWFDVNEVIEALKAYQADKLEGAK